jgi:hypothetical protein
MFIRCHPPIAGRERSPSIAEATQSFTIPIENIGTDYVRGMRWDSTLEDKATIEVSTSLINLSRLEKSRHSQLRLIQQQVWFAQLVSALLRTPHHEPCCSRRVRSALIRGSNLTA